MPVNCKVIVKFFQSVQILGQISYFSKHKTYTESGFFAAVKTKFLHPPRPEGAMEESGQTCQILCR